MNVVTCVRLSTLLFASAALAGSVSAQQAAPSATTDDRPDEVVTLPEFSVNTSRDDGYVATQSTSGTRIATEIINLPFSVSVMTEEFIKEFQLFDLDQQAPFFSGMAAGDPNQGGGGGTRLRGFSVPYFRNGFYRTQAPDSNSIARVEVVKGPQSAIYGRVSPGGVVNYISKKPATKFRATLAATYGSYDYARWDGSVTGPLVADKLFYRVDAAYYDFKRSTDFWYNRTRNLSGGFTYKVSPNTQITLEHEHTYRVMQGGQAFTRWTRSEPTYTSLTSTAPISITEGSVYYMPDRELGQRLAEFATSGAHNQVKRLSNSSYFTIEHRINSQWSARLGTTYSTREFRRHGTSTPVTWATNPTAARQTVLNSLNGIWVDTTRGIWTGDRAGAHQEIDYSEKGVQFDLTKKWEGRWPQRTLFVFDIYTHDQHQRTWALSGTPLNNALAALGMTTTAQQNAWKNPDPLNPAVSGYYPNPSFDPATWTITASGTSYFDRLYYGSLLNHTIDFMRGRLSWTGSIRKDWAEFMLQPHGAPKNQDNIQQATYNTGLNYHVIPRAMVAYGNYATGFNPSPQFDPNTTELLGNQESVGGEIGIKGLLWNDVFSYGVAAYQVEQSNEVTDNPANPAGQDLSQPRFIGGATTRAKGINVDLTGKVTKNLQMVGTVTWTDVRIIQHASNSDLIGTRPTGTQGVPPRTYSLASTYRFRQGFLQGVRVGMTYQYAQSYLRIVPVYTTVRLAANPAQQERVMTTVPYFIDEKSEWSANIGYAPKKFKNGMRLNLSLNVFNLFDERKMTVAAYAPEGRTYRLRADLTF